MNTIYKDNAEVGGERDTEKIMDMKNQKRHDRKNKKKNKKQT